jgi:phosphate transport system substrate-binding protein
MIAFLTAITILSLLILSACTTGQAAPGQTTPAQASPTRAPDLTGTFKIIGSNTVTPISTVWAEQFMKANPKVSIAVSGPGSGVGIAALIDGTTDICQSSRPITQDEIAKAKANNRNPVEFTIAYDGVAIVVNTANPVKELTTDQIAAIYTGKVTNWKDFSVKDSPIVVLSRDSSSGTYAFFKEHILQTKDKKADYGEKTLYLPSTEAGISEVTRNDKAIFYA